MIRRVAGALSLLGVALLMPFLSHADVNLKITEILYDAPGANAGHQWIKVSNVGDASIDLGAKTIRLFDSSGRHLIKTDPDTTGESTVLSPGDTVVIAQNPTQFRIDYPGFSGTVLKSSFALTAAGTVGIMQTDGTILASGKPVVKAKPVATKASTTKKAAASKSSAANSKKSSSKTTYDTGTVAPDATAEAAASGALFGFSGFTIPNLPVLSSVWFAGFLGLLAFSGFSLILIRKQL